MATVPDIPVIRYADDWCALARTPEAAEQALTVAQRVLTDLHLTLHPEKTRIVDVYGQSFDFLDFTFFWTRPKTGPGRPLFGPKRAAIERLKDRIRLLTQRTRPFNIQMVIEDLAPVIRGWGRYFTISHAGDYYRLDAWIRERCRAFVAKRGNRNPQRDGEWTNPRLAHLGLPSLALMRRHVLTQSPRP